mmetsp:Transcript_17345/g.40432  ORF Transcript_17345/g.40432 Transcript_17345/m.40432 type:complete len:203 (+) Transcript_17345:630-1238(+)
MGCERIFELSFKAGARIHGSLEQNGEHYHEEAQGSQVEREQDAQCQVPRALHSRHRGCNGSAFFVATVVEQMSVQSPLQLVGRLQPRHGGRGDSPQRSGFARRPRLLERSVNKAHLQEAPSSACSWHSLRVESSTYMDLRCIFQASSLRRSCRYHTVAVTVTADNDMAALSVTSRQSWSCMALEPATLQSLVLGSCQPRRGI